LWWFDAMGLFDATTDEVFDPGISRDQPSLQLVGRPDHASLDLAILRQRGVRVVGRALAIDGTRVSIDADDLVATTVAADAKLATLLGRIDRFAVEQGLLRDAEPSARFVPVWPVFDPSPSALDLRSEGIRTVIWATGFRRRYPWLEVPVCDSKGEIRHQGGVTPAGGLYVLGLQFQRRRKSAFIDGVGDDARELAAHVAGWLAGRRASARSGSGWDQRWMPCPA
jgi:putative flavoprotein involved in K+ transport